MIEQTLKPVDKSFYWQRSLNWILLGLMYAFFYFGRYNLAASQTVIAEVFGWSYTDYGSILSLSLLVYGASVFLNGPLCDKIGGKKAILIGAAGASVFNFLFGLSYLLVKQPAVLDKVHKVITPASLSHGLAAGTLITMLAVIWMFNHYFQSFGALSVIKVNSAWFQVHERGKLAGLFSIPIQFGRFLGTFVCSALVFVLPWQYVFWIPAVLLMAMVFIGRKYINDSPKDIGYDYFDTPTMDTEKVKISLVLKKVFANKVMWVFAFLSMCLGITRNSIDHWYPKYFQIMYGIKATDLINYWPYKFVVLSVPFALIATGLISGIVSTKYFQSRRGPIVLFSFIGQTLSLLFFTQYITNPWVSAIALILVLSSVQAGHSIIAAAASMDIGGRKAAATAAGFIDGMQYLAGAVVGYGMARILNAYTVAGHPGQEFHIWPWVPIPMAIIGIFLALSIWNVSPQEKGAH